MPRTKTSEVKKQRGRPRKNVEETEIKEVIEKKKNTNSLLKYPLRIDKLYMYNIYITPEKDKPRKKQVEESDSEDSDYTASDKARQKKSDKVEARLLQEAYDNELNKTKKYSKDLNKLINKCLKQQ